MKNVFIDDILKFSWDSNLMNFSSWNSCPNVDFAFIVQQKIQNTNQYKKIFLHHFYLHKKQ